MNRLHLTGWTTRILSLCCIVSMMFSVEKVMAKLTVTKPKITTTPFSGLGHSDKLELACEGYYTYITIDANGDTQVYVNDDGGSYSTDEKYRVELPEEMHDWSRITILGCKSSRIPITTCPSVHIKMDGGLVSDIDLAVPSYTVGGNKVTGDVELIVNGGTVYSISSSANIQGNISISLSNMRYTGSKPLFLADDETKARTTLFINNNCTFYTSTARLKPEDVAACKSAIIPDPVDDMTVRSFGASVIPADHTINCDNFYYNQSFTLYGNLNVRKCNGFVYNGTSSAPLIKSTHLSVKEHQHIQNKLTPATCTRAATYRSYCDVCHQTLKQTINEAALGHNLIADPAVSATCESTGLTAGEHCSRCGLVTVAQNVIAAKGHNTVRVSSNDNFTACFGRAITTVACTKCFKVETSASPLISHDWVPASRTISTDKNLSTKPQVGLDQGTDLNNLLFSLNRAATCTSKGIKFYYCSKCKFVKSEEIPALGHNMTDYPAVSATCEEGGMKAYSKCTNNNCTYMINDKGTVFKETADLYIAPFGHSFGVSASYVKNKFTHVSNATCSDDELYHQSCSRCGMINEDLFFTGNKAFGHDYYIRSIDYKSPTYPESGIFTMGCHQCEMAWPNFQFSIDDYAGEFDEDEDNVTDKETPEGHVFAPHDLSKFHGFCIHTYLESVDVIPTCVPGHGTYRINFYYNDKAMTTTYDNFVRPSGYVHNYGADGVCRETHYKIAENVDPRFEGEILKDRNGNILYEEDQDGNLIVDNTVYSAKAFIAVPITGYYLSNSSIIKTLKWDRITGKVLTYPEWRGNNFQSIDSSFGQAVSDSLAHHGSAVVSFYQNLDINTVFDMDLPGLTVKDNGYNVSAHLADAAVYARTSDATFSELTYTRDFPSNVFAAHYIPFDLAYNDWKDYADIYKIVNIYENDDDNDGHVDCWTLRILKLTEGSIAKANTPYIIKPKEAGVMTLDLSNVVVHAAEKNNIWCASTDYKFTFTGTYSSKTIGPDREFFMSTTGGLQYYGGTTRTTLSPQRWYMVISDKETGINVHPSEFGLNTAARISIRVEDEETTGIEQVEDQSLIKPMHEAAIYDLQGRRLDAPRHGINIINGRKVMM